MVRRGSVWLLVGALIAGLVTALSGSAAQAAADGTRYYFASDPDNGYDGYVVRIRFSGKTAYLREPSKNDRCVKAKLVGRTWRYKQPIAAEAGDPVPARFTTNADRTRVWFDDQYEDFEWTYRRISRAKADRWLRAVDDSQSWSRRC